MMDRSALTAIYEFWFAGETRPDTIDPARIAFWMHRNDETDRLVRDGFGHLIAEAACHDWELAELSRQEAVALIVLFDQFPRNIYRTTGDAFATDHLARDLARRMTAGGWDCFTAAERFFLGLTWVHHEDMDSQDHGVMLAAREAILSPVAAREAARFGLDQAIRHRAVIQRFGRFPHRNAMLGRRSTPEEIEFMAGAINGRGF
jgi:uncharacterized protein (DUF924 family)